MSPIYHHWHRARTCAPCRSWVARGVSVAHGIHQCVQLHGRHQRYCRRTGGRYWSWRGVLTGFATGGWTSPPVLLGFVLAGSAAGFLPHNFPRARMFMGDVSSAPLGFLLASTVL